MHENPMDSERSQRRTTCGKLLEQFEPGFYSDGETVYVDMDEFLETYGICDVPEIRAVLWADILEVFGDVQINELRANTSTPLPRKRNALT
jgi:hypothetical protein